MPARLTLTQFDPCVSSPFWSLQWNWVCLSYFTSLIFWRTQFLFWFGVYQTSSPTVLLMLFSLTFYHRSLKFVPNSVSQECIAQASPRSQKEPYSRHSTFQGSFWTMWFLYLPQQASRWHCKSWLQGEMLALSSNASHWGIFLLLMQFLHFKVYQKNQVPPPPPIHFTSLCRYFDHRRLILSTLG